MKQRIPVVVIVTSLTVFLLVHWYVLSRTPRWDPVGDHASFRTNDWGVKACRELLGRIGVETAAWEADWTDLPARVELLWILDPTQTPTEKECEGLLSWVHEGGRAVIAPEPRRSPDAVRGGDKEANVLMLARLGWLALATTQKEDARVRPAGQHPLLRDVREVLVPSSRRLRAAPSEAQIRAALRQVSGGDDSIEAPAPMITPTPETLLEDRAGIVAARVRHGKGQMILLCDANIIANKWIGEADNVVLATNLALPETGATVWFDERHHGVISRLPSELDATAPTRAIWAGIIALGLFYLGRFWRFGAAVPARAPSRRSSLEYVRAFASLYQRAGRRQAVLAMIEKRFRARISLLVGIRADASPGDMAAAVSRRYANIDRPRLEELLARCKRAAEPGHKLSDSDLLALTREASRIEQETMRHDP